MKKLASTILVSGLLIFLTFGFPADKADKQKTVERKEYFLRVGMLNIHIPHVFPRREDLGPEKWAERIEEWNVITNKVRELINKAIDSVELDIILAPEFSFCKKIPYTYKEVLGEVADFQKKLKKNGPILFLPFVYIDGKGAVCNVVMVVAPADTKLVYDPVVLSDGRVLEPKESTFCYYQMYDPDYHSGDWTRARMDRERNYKGGKNPGVFYLLNPNKYGKLKVGLEICVDFGSLYHAWEYVDLQILIANNVWSKCYPYFEDVATQHFLLCDGIAEGGGPIEVRSMNGDYRQYYSRDPFNRYGCPERYRYYPDISMVVYCLPVKEFQVDLDREREKARAKRLGLKKENPCEGPHIPF